MVVILSLLLLMLMSYYSLEHNNNDPDAQYILDHYEQLNITKVALTGEVKSVDSVNNTLVIQVNQLPRSLVMVNITNDVNRVQIGDILEVYGILTSRDTITAEKLLISERWKHDLIYVRSLPAIPFALYLFFRTWHFNPETRRFERRGKNA
jgi:hypothetical protein